MRLNSSRPSSSVPKTKRPLGSRRGRARISTGSWRAISGAKSALRQSSAAANAPTSSLLLRVKGRQSRRARAAGPGRSTAGCSAAISAPRTVLDARVNQAVEQVHDEIDQHEQRRDQEYDRLHDRVIAARDRVQGEGADPGPGEDLLHDHRAAEQVPDLNAD